jgi:hypothetical protein
VEALEKRSLLAVNLLSSFTGMNQLAAAGPNNNPGFVTIYSPPDTTGAAGPTEYVEAANMGIRISNKTTGASIATDSVHDFMFTQGGLAQVMPIPGPPANAPDNLSDVTMVWDNLVQRFIIGVQDVNGSTSSAFDVAISKSASPATLTAADWNFYQVNTTESGLTPDYPGNLGYNADAFVFTLNENGTNGHVLVVSMKISDMVAGNSTTPFLNDVSGFSLRPTEMHDSKPGDPMWLLESQTGGGSSITVLRMDNVLSNSPTITTTNVTVNSYSGVVQPLQPNGTGLAPASGNGALWTHILKAAEYNNTIVACDQISASSTEDDARWYAIDVSGTPTINASIGQGNVSAGNNTYVVFPSIEINSKGDIGMTYSFSGTGAGQFMSMYVVGRAAGDAAGTMQAPVLVQAGAANSTDGREGDLSGSSVDSTPLTVTAAADQSAVEGAPPIFFSLGSFTDSEGNFWAANEWATQGTTSNPWSTTIGQFALSTNGPWTVDVSWGDGTPDTVFNTTSLGTITPQSHTYGEEGTYTATVTVTDTSDSHSDSKPFAVTVTDPPVAASGVPVFATACSTAMAVSIATFKDPGGAEPNPSDPTPGISNHYTVMSIDWGDSTPLDTTSGSISYSGTPGSTTDPFTVSGTHTYATEGTFTITAIIDHEGKLTTVTTTAIVKDKLGLLLLDPTGSQSLMVTGNGSVDVTGDCGAVVVDSNDATKAAFVTGNGVVAAGDFDVTGGVFTAGHGVVPSPIDHEAPTADPLGLALPSPPSPTFGALHITGGTATPPPGTYVGGISVSGKSTVTLSAGVYYMEGGGFSVRGGAVVNGTSGVVIINAPAGPNDSISVSGKGVLDLTAPTSGPFQGVALFQAPSSSITISFTGQANVTIIGVMYAPAAPVSITGNAVVTINPSTTGTATLPPIFAAMIAYDAQVTGNGVLTINADDPPGQPAILLRGNAGSGSAGNFDAAIAALSSGTSPNNAVLIDPLLFNSVASDLQGSGALGTWLTGGKRSRR